MDVDEQQQQQQGVDQSYVNKCQEQVRPFLAALDINPGDMDGNSQFTDQEGFEESYFDSFPPGYRFCPWDSELIVDYLKKKILEEPLPRNQIRDVNVYLHSPDILTERYTPAGLGQWYFFTQREKNNEYSSRQYREAGSGFWKVTGEDSAIQLKDTVVGFKKAWVFYEGKVPVGRKTNWTMQEYRVNESPRQESASSTGTALHDFVLCRIYKTKPENSNKSRGSQISQTQMRGQILEQPTQEGTVIYLQNGYTPIHPCIRTSSSRPVNYLGGMNSIGLPENHRVSANSVTFTNQANRSGQLIADGASTSTQIRPMILTFPSRTDFMAERFQQADGSQGNVQTTLQNRHSA
ncbi:unnamed protein product [Coffea canephora]|uniref:NAC domain-containing protein n=1 Tax=Coffea canephora TaxID=49390 RepID=A0A068V419_COFCA|nr:unnamed protein product [Coffea canephora]